MVTFTDEPWDAGAASKGMSPEDWCSLCLVDANPEGQPKVKALCKLPVRATPGGDYSRAALRNAASRIEQMTGVSDADTRKTASRLVGLMKQAGIEPGDSMMQLAGRK